MKKQDKLWSELPEDYKKYLRALYNESYSDQAVFEECCNIVWIEKITYEATFGKSNLEETLPGDRDYKTVVPVWDDLSQESQEWIRKIHKKLLAHQVAGLTGVEILEKTFGRDNIVPPRQYLKFEDLEDHEVCYSCFLDLDGETEREGILLSGEFKDSVVTSASAVIKIVTLIERGYKGPGGNWVIVPGVYGDMEVKESHSERTPLRFMTKHLAKKFLENNEKLCRDYYKIF